MRPDIGCLLIGQTPRLHALRERLSARGVHTVDALRDGDLLCAAQEGLKNARRVGGVCVAAEGELWAAALALAAQLCVDRVVLIAPTDRFQNPKDHWERQIERLKGFARRNLFFCVSEVLVLEDGCSEKRMDAVFRRMCNARIYRLSLSDGRWGGQSPMDEAARFLKDGDFVFSLAK